jgi:CrcB protein
VTEPDRDGAADGLAALPIDPDVDAAEDANATGRTVAPAVDVFAEARRRRRPRLRRRVLAAVFAGGFAGGWARYAVTAAWPTPAAGVPWATFAVNTAGAFALALLLVLVTEVWRPTTYVRPLFGTGFLGAFTTFSAVVTTTDQLAARGAAGTAAFYLVISMFAGLAAASFGLVTGRAVAASRQRNRQPPAGRP